NRTTERDGFGIHSKIEAGGELKPAEDAERILAEGGTDVTKQAALEIATACMRIDDFAGCRIVTDCVDREIASRGGLGESERGIRFNRKAAMAAPGFSLPAGQGKIVFMASDAHLDDT